MEIFIAIPEYNNYEMSLLGNIRNKTTGKILKQYFNKKTGYYTVNLKINEKHYSKRYHRLYATTFIENPENKPCVDHIDNNTLNNHISNLRWATHTENSQNSKISNKNTSGIKGVSFHTRYNIWEAYISINGIKKHIGRFPTSEEARYARIIKATEIQGLFMNACEVQ